MSSCIVRISDIGLYLRCPMLVYFEALGRLEKKINAEKLLMHSLMISLPSECCNESDLSFLLERLKIELPVLYDIEPEEVARCAENLSKNIGLIAAEIETCRDQLFPFEAEVDLRSEKLGISGRLDRISQGEIPCLIRTGQAPTSGVWKSDRLVLAGYALLLGENLNRKINQGLVEYPLSGTARKLEIRSIDKARVLRIRDRIKLIKNGQLPDRPRDAPCSKCMQKEICEGRQTIASKFF